MYTELLVLNRVVGCNCPLLWLSTVTDVVDRCSGTGLATLSLLASLAARTVLLVGGTFGIRPALAREVSFLATMEANCILLVLLGTAGRTLATGSSFAS